MMRSLYSGVSGLRVHQTKMDVIGNNISNVNTVGFKSSSVTFSDILYQTTKSAAGPNADTGKAGQNAKQIGLGATVSSITASVTTAGGSQRTDNPFDISISGDSFFIVNDAGSNYFTKAGNFTVDANGTLCTPTGAAVMGWQPSAEDPTKVEQTTVSKLNIMSATNMFSEPEATTDIYLTGNIDANDTSLTSTAGKIVNFNFYDSLGNSYTAAMAIHQNTEDDGKTSEYTATISNIYDADGKSIFVAKDLTEDGEYQASTITEINLGGETLTVEELDPKTGAVSFGDDPTSIGCSFDPTTGKFVTVGDEEGQTSTTFSVVADPSPFSEITIDFSSLTMYANSGSTSIESTRGNLETGLGAGKASGEMSGVSIDTAGKIYGVYDNGDSKLLGQIAVASFANPSGLEAVGNNMFAETLNSGEFTGVGQDISASGGSMTTGVLEMSNVDLSAEFTEMITTQRGFQASSRIITTSDSLIEELVNLKR